MFFSHVNPMRRTRKRGGNQLTEEQKEAQDLLQRVHLFTSASTHEEKKERAREFLQAVLQSRIVVRNRRFRPALQDQINRAWDFDIELRPLIRQVQAHLDSLPMNAAGRKRKTRRSHRK